MQPAIKQNLTLQIGVSKVKKYASAESGDTLEFIERPGGGISVVLADGQRSGKSAKRISNIVVRKVISLLADGVRDGAAARAASDYLFHERAGKVSATLNILSVDLRSNTLVISCNNHSPVYISRANEIETFGDQSLQIGVYLHTKPVIQEIPIHDGLTVLVFTDGVPNAGRRTNEKLDIQAVFRESLDSQISTQEMADFVLDRAVNLDQGRPVDDVSVVVLQVSSTETQDLTRKITVNIPF